MSQNHLKLTQGKLNSCTLGQEYNHLNVRKLQSKYVKMKLRGAVTSIYWVHGLMNNCQWNIILHLTVELMFNIQRIKYIRLYLTSEACQTLVSSLVMLHLDYTNSLFYGLPECDIGHLHRVQNCVAKMVLNRSKYESCRKAFIGLHWLSIRQWIKHKILLLVFNCINKTSPST